MMAIPTVFPAVFFDAAAVFDRFRSVISWPFAFKYPVILCDLEKLADYSTVYARQFE
jgi:hypothetical protein